MKKLLLIAIASLISSIAFSQVSKTQIDAALQAKGLDPSANDAYIITSQSSSKDIGVSHVYLRQTLNGIEIFNANPALHFDKIGNMFSFSNAFIKSAKSKLVASNNNTSYNKAIEIVAKQLGLSVNFSVNKTNPQSNEYIVIDKKASSQDIKAKLYYLLLDKEIRQVLNIEFFDDKTGDWWNKRVDVNTGKIIDENNWTTQCNVKQTTKRIKKNEKFSFVFEDKENLLKTGNGSYKVFPIPAESPQKAPHQMVNNPAYASASPFGWHDVDGINGADYTITRGNNVWAMEDTLNTNDTTGFSPDGGPSLNFDFPYNPILGVSPRTNLNSAITNLFYWNNVTHDVFYQYGFDEQSGNFQQTNYSQNGYGNDYVFADAQDGSGKNNANFGTPPDGSNPRMQMYVWQIGSDTNLFHINSPSFLKGRYTSSLASFGPYPMMPGVKADLVIAQDASANPNLACETIVNDVNGKIAVIDRGSCFFVDKVYNAQLAGAKAAIIINNVPGPSFSMGTSSTSTDALINIPSIMISKDLGDSLKQYLQNSTTINASISDSLGPKFTDSDFDNGVIVHEYTHGLSNRLTGGPFNTSCLSNAEQGGEGWSDFFAIALTSHSYDNPQTGRGMGMYLQGEDTTDLGIRTYRYSRSLAINPVTYDSIKRKDNNEVHYVGFVWCSMLYDIFWDMSDKYGFSNDIYNGNGGNNKAMKLVMEGLKLQPCSPGFVDARDAILLADSLLNNFANKDLLWKAFARRGLGYGADQGSSMDATDGIESFKLPPPPKQNTGMDDLLNEKSVKLYPNPNKGSFTIETDIELKMNAVNVFDITGKKVFSEELHKKNSMHQLNLSSIKTGIYIVQIETEKGSICKKMIVE